MFALTVCTMVKGENSYLPEWLGHHVGLGVEHFFIYDNESPLPLSETLQPEISKGLVTVVPFAGRAQQFPAFNDALHRFGSETEWMGFIDLDEFLCPKTHDDLRTLLQEYAEYGGLAINWQMFGSSGYGCRPPGLQIENFLMKAKVQYGQNRHLKCLVRPRTVERVADAHHCIYRTGYQCVTERRHRVAGGQSPVSVQLIQINHYYTRSRHEYGEKLARGRADCDGPMAFTFDQIDPALNRIRDESILRFAPRIKAYLKERGCS